MAITAQKREQMEQAVATLCLAREHIFIALGETEHYSEFDVAIQELTQMLDELMQFM